MKANNSVVRRFVFEPFPRPTSRHAYLLAVAVGAGFAVAQILVLPNALEPLAFGMVSLALSGVQAINQFGDFGFTTAASNSSLMPGSRGRMREAAFTLTSASALITVVAAAMLSVLGAIELSAALTVCLGIFAAWGVTASRVRANAYAAAGNETSALFENVRWQHSYKIGLVSGAFSGNAIVTLAAACTSALSLSYAAWPHLRVPWAYLRRTWRHWAPGLTLAASAFLISWVDSYAIAWTSGTEAVGRYQAVMRPLLGVTFLYLPLIAIVQASLSVSDTARANRARKALLLITGVSLAVAVPILIGFGTTIWPSYEFATPVVLCCALSVFFGALSAAFGIELVVRGAVAQCASANVVGAIVIASMATALIPVLGLLGAAIASLSGWVITSLPQIYWVWRFRNAERRAG